MRQWFYATPGGQQAQTSEAELVNLVKSGQITPDTLVWRDGLAQWTPAAVALPALFSSSAAVTQPLVKEPPTPPPMESAPSPVPASEPAPTPASTPPIAPAIPVAPVLEVTPRPAPTIAPSYGAAASAQDALVRRVIGPLFERKGWLKFVAIMTIIGGVLTAIYLIGILLIVAGVFLLKAAGALERAHASGDVAAAENAQRELSKFFLISGIFSLVYLAIMTLVVIFVIVTLVTGGAGLLHSFRQQQPASGEPLRWEEFGLPDPTATPDADPGLPDQEAEDEDEFTPEPAEEAQ